MLGGDSSEGNDEEDKKKKDTESNLDLKEEISDVDGDGDDSVTKLRERNSKNSSSSSVLALVPLKKRKIDTESIVGSLPSSSVVSVAVPIDDHVPISSQSLGGGTIAATTRRILPTVIKVTAFSDLMGSSSSTVQAQSNATQQQQQQHHPSSSFYMGLPQDHFTNVSGSAFIPSVLRQQPPLLQDVRGLDLNQPANNDGEEDGGLDLNQPAPNE